MRDFQGVFRLFSRQARDQSPQASPDQAFCVGRPFISASLCPCQALALTLFFLASPGSTRH